MTTSTIEHMNGMDSISIENIPTDKLEEILDSINRQIEKYIQERYEVLSELATRKDSNTKDSNTKDSNIKDSNTKDLNTKDSNIKDANREETSDTG